MPRQNRVDPFGRIVAHPARGMLMGNRGCLHDDAGRIVRTSARSAWISCVPSWPGVRRSLMQPGHYTELFFLDEATALAAGHRPCDSCRPEALAAFKSAWQRAFGLARLPLVAEIDHVLRTSTCREVVSTGTVPEGSMIAVDGRPLLRGPGRWLAWTPDGYSVFLGEPPALAAALTCAALRAALDAGYRPTVHPSAERLLHKAAHQ